MDHITRSTILMVSIVTLLATTIHCTRDLSRLPGPLKYGLRGMRHLPSTVFLSCADDHNIHDDSG